MFDPIEISRTVYDHITASFGPISYDVSGTLILAQPHYFCSPQSDFNATGKVVLLRRGNCSFVDKVMNAQDLGAIGAIVGNNPDEEPELVRMAYEFGFDPESVKIPSLFVSYLTFTTLVDIMSSASDPVIVEMNTEGEVFTDLFYVDSTAGYILLALPLLWIVLLMFVYIRRVVRSHCAREARTVRTRDLPMMEYHKVAESQDGAANGNNDSTSVSRSGLETKLHNDTCAICLDDFEEGVAVKVLPCAHGFHNDCIDPWLNERSDLCPICKTSILAPPTPRSPRSAAPASHADPAREELLQVGVDISDE